VLSGNGLIDENIELQKQAFVKNELAESRINWRKMSRRDAEACWICPL
jgi:hypothetical protein